MSDLDLDSQAILNGLVYLDRHQQLHPNSTKSAKTEKSTQSEMTTTSGDASANIANSESIPANAVGSAGLYDPPAIAAAATASYQGMDGPRAIAHLKVETSAVLKELARFRACDDETMSCFYCREWSQWVYRKQISHSVNPNAIQTASSSKKKKKNQRQSSHSQQHQQVQQDQYHQSVLENSELEKEKRSLRNQFKSVDELCQNLRELVSDEDYKWKERESNINDDDGSRSGVSSPSPSIAAASLPKPKGKDSEGGFGSGQSSDLIDTLIHQVTQWYQGHTFPLAEVYEDLTFDLPPEGFPYEENQDPLDPARLLPVLEVSKTFISLSSQHFPLLGNITSELIATHTYPTCQHNKTDNLTPSELECQRVIFNSHLTRHRKEYKENYEREMEPVWQITQLLLKSIQRIEAMRVRLFTRSCHQNQQQFMQSIKSKAQPFSEYWGSIVEKYRGLDAGPGDTPETGDQKPRPGKPSVKGGKSNSASTSLGSKSQDQLAKDIDKLFNKHLDNTMDACNSWGRTFLESYYTVAREFARELETILGECITMCDRRAQGLKYPPALTLQPRIEKARRSIANLHPKLEKRIEDIQNTVRDRSEEIFRMTEDIRNIWAKESGSSIKSKLEKASQKEFRKRLKRVEFYQHVKVISWSMEEIESLLTSSDVAWVAIDCIELLMTEAETLERAVAHVFIRKMEQPTEDLRDQRQDIMDDFTEGLLTGREELAGVIGKLLLKEAWRILESNISLQRQNALLGMSEKTTKGGGGKSSDSQGRATGEIPEHIESLVTEVNERHFGEAESSGKKKKKKKNKKKKSKAKSVDDDTTSVADSGTIDALDNNEMVIKSPPQDEGDVSRTLGSLAEAKSGEAGQALQKPALTPAPLSGKSMFSSNEKMGDQGDHMFMIDQMRLADMYNEAISRNQLLEGTIQTFQEQVIGLRHSYEEIEEQLRLVRQQEAEHRKVAEELREDSEKWHQWFETVQKYFQSLPSLVKEASVQSSDGGEGNSRRSDSKTPNREGSNEPGNNESEKSKQTPESQDRNVSASQSGVGSQGRSARVPENLDELAQSPIPNLPNHMFPGMSNGSMPVLGFPMSMNWNEMSKSNMQSVYGFNFPPPMPPSFANGVWNGPNHPSMNPEMCMAMMRGLYGQGTQPFPSSNGQGIPGNTISTSMENPGMTPVTVGHSSGIENGTLGAAQTMFDSGLEMGSSSN
ncbi:hypothetical protein H4219_002972 [Mycoemilia scoparia]|uniref:Uncharacterized protein n=1 Tax=Mycoemilia scoparia TaxID=417184 RepID=A0A9W8DPX2_9FUNG|nr:hypothetical protein H4219_002972 [Mycoemilia scoparia]